MLILTPNSNEQVRIDTPSGPIVISVRVRHDRKGMLAIDAPHTWKISREARHTPLHPRTPLSAAHQSGPDKKAGAVGGGL